MTSPPFQFGFDLGGDDAKNAASENSEPASAKKGMVNSSRIPFRWLDVRALLSERTSSQPVPHEVVEFSKTANNDREYRLLRCNVDTSFGSITKKDIEDGIYEGGLKVWECSYDLCHYLMQQPPHSSIYQEGSSILELGCGHGLPACLVLREIFRNGKTAKISFLDYNEFVLKDVTLPNILLNSDGLSIDISSHVSLGAGDWMQLTGPGLSNGANNFKFDLIMASETTYSPTAAQETALFLQRHLRVNTGIALLACKRYYFGVGGGSLAFRGAASALASAVASHYFEITQLEEYDNGSGNIRELLKVRYLQRKEPR